MGFFAALLMIAAGCAPTTQLETSWKDPAAKPLAFTKVAVVVLNSSPAERRAEEEELVAQIKKATAVASYTFVSDEELTDSQKVKSKIIQGGFDGAVVLRLIDSKKQASYVPGSSSYWYDGAGYTAYSYNPGYYVTDTIIRAEVSVYSVPDGKLLWAGSSTTVNPENARKLAMQVSQAAAAELRKVGLLQ
jgi:hypothetical protein